MNITHGTQLQEEPATVEWVVGQGWKTTRRWSGSEAEVRSFVPTLKAAGYSFNVIQGPTWKITATIGADTIFNDTSEPPSSDVPLSEVWEIYFASYDKDLLSSINDLDTIKSVGVTIQPETIKWLRDLQSNKSLGGLPTPPPKPFINTKEAAIFIQLYYLMSAGTKSVSMSYPVIKRTLTVSNSYQLTSTALSGVNQVWMRGTLISQTNIPNTIVSALPESSTEQVPILGTALATTFYTGYLKHYPTVQQIGTDKFQVVQEWQYGKWAALLYELY